MASINTMSSENLNEIKNQGEKLLKNRVSTPEVPASEAHSTGERHKPHGVQEESNRETNKMSKTEEIEEGKKTAASKQVGELGQKPATEKDKDEAIEAARKEEMIRQGAERSKKLGEDLEKTKEAREKQPENEKELAERQKEIEKQVLRQTKEHEEKQAEKESTKGHTAVLDGSATRNSMKAEEKLMELKADPTPGMDKAASKQRDM